MGSQPPAPWVNGHKRNLVGKPQQSRLTFPCANWCDEAHAAYRQEDCHHWRCIDDQGWQRGAKEVTTPPLHRVPGCGQRSGPLFAGPVSNKVLGAGEMVVTNILRKLGNKMPDGWSFKHQKYQGKRNFGMCRTFMTQHGRPESMLSLVKNKRHGVQEVFQYKGGSRPSPCLRGGEGRIGRAMQPTRTPPRLRL